jgi:hypothetical protein
MFVTSSFCFSKINSFLLERRFGGSDSGGKKDYI